MDLIEQRPMLVRLAYKLTRNASLAQDIADQTIGQAFVNLHQWKGENFPAWVRSIAINIIRHWSRDTKRDARHLPDLWKMKRDEMTPLQSALRRELRAAVQEALEQLTEKQKQCVKLSEVDGLDFVTIGEIVGVKPGAARALAFRARAHLRRHLERFIA